MNSQISLTSTVIFADVILILVVFVGYSFFQRVIRRTRMSQAQIYYLIFCVSYISWAACIILMGFTPDDNYERLKILDALTHIGSGVTPVTMFLICLCFISGEKGVAKGWNLLYSVPLISNILIWTNDWHHLIYSEFLNGKVFSIAREDIVIGWYSYFEGVFSYAILIIATILIVVRAVKKKEKIVWAQSSSLIIGFMIPVIVSMMATLVPSLGFKITATPLAYISEVICNYLAIYQFHIMDIVPLATKKLLEMIPDSFLIINDKFTVVECNQAFMEKPAKYYGIEKGTVLDEKFMASHQKNGVALHTLVSGIRSCPKKDGKSVFEQTVFVPGETADSVVTFVYFIEIQTIELPGSTFGIIVIFRDISAIKKQLSINQENQERLVEQERLAMLGTMVGGMAHNLKSPIMSITGATMSVDTLIEEIKDSLGDQDVTIEDYKEICREMSDWMMKTREACHYMSDVIDTVRKQAKNATTDEKNFFTIDELMKCCDMLMKHDLKTNNVTLRYENSFQDKLKLYGDITNLVQVINNLVKNGIDATKNSNVKELLMSIYQENNKVHISLRDYGPGVPAEMKDKLFKEMFTTKGVKGTGLGLYVSSTIVKSKFDGKMWYKDAEDGGAIFGMTLPLIETVESEKIDEKE